MFNIKTVQQTKKIISITILIFAIIIASVYFLQNYTKNSDMQYNDTQYQYKYVVMINKTANHAALDKTIQGIKDFLNLEFKSEIQILVESSQSNPNLANQIASKFAHQGNNITKNYNVPTVFVGVGTGAAQSFLKYLHNTEKKSLHHNSTTNKISQNQQKWWNPQMVFTSITDPEISKLNRENVTGISNFVDLNKQITFFKQIQPNLKRLGIIYNPEEINSIKILQILEKIAPNHKIHLIKQTISKIPDITQNTTKLAQSVDAIFIGQDNTALSGIDNILKITNTAKIPLYASDTDLIKKGVLAALGIDQYEMGIETGKIIKNILLGTNIKDIKIKTMEQIEAYINLDTANSLSVNVKNVESHNSNTDYQIKFFTKQDQTIK